MNLSFQHRLEATEIMDDLRQPDREFAAAYRELEIINANLGGVRATERFLPRAADLLMLDVAAGACDVSEALLRHRRCRIVTLDLNARGLRLAKHSWPVVGDALDLPFGNDTFDVVMTSLFFHHLRTTTACGLYAKCGGSRVSVYSSMICTGTASHISRSGR